MINLTSFTLEKYSKFDRNGLIRNISKHDFSHYFWAKNETLKLDSKCLEVQLMK